MKTHTYIIIAIIYRFLLDLIYKLEVSPIFSYARLVNESTQVSTYTSWLLFVFFTILIIPFLSDKNDYFIDCVVIFFYLIRIVPFTSFIKFSPQTFEYLCLNIIYWSLLLLLLRIPGHSRFNFLLQYRNDNSVMFFAIVSIVAVLVVSGVYTHFRFHFSLSNVYDLRAEARTYQMPRIFAYLYSATGNLIPIILVFYILKKKKVMIFLLALTGILNFGIAGQKATIFKIVFCVIFIFVKEIDYKKYLLPIISIFCVLVLGQYFIWGNVELSTLFIRRMLYVPNMNDTLYYDYIMTHSPLFFNSQKSGELAFNLSEIYMRRSEARANNGMFSDAYANLGAWGIVVFPVLLSTLLKFFSNSVKGLHPSLVVYTAMIVATALHSSFITRSLLTHGLFILWLALMILPRDSETKI